MIVYNYLAAVPRIEMAFLVNQYYYARRITTRYRMHVRVTLTAKIAIIV